MDNILNEFKRFSVSITFAALFTVVCYTVAVVIGVVAIVAIPLAALYQAVDIYNSK